MPVKLNHTIVHAQDREATADFWVRILGLTPPTTFGPFLAVRAANEVTLDVMGVDGPVTGQHYAFLVTEEEFDEIFGRIQAEGVPYWADPMHMSPGRINHDDGGRGVYFLDPNGHNLEILTVPYGGWPAAG